MANAYTGKFNTTVRNRIGKVSDGSIGPLTTADFIPEPLATGISDKCSYNNSPELKEELLNLFETSVIWKTGEDKIKEDRYYTGETITTLMEISKWIPKEHKKYYGMSNSNIATFVPYNPKVSKIFRLTFEGKQHPCDIKNMSFYVYVMEDIATSKEFFIAKLKKSINNINQKEFIDSFTEITALSQENPGTLYLTIVEPMPQTNEPKSVIKLYFEASAKLLNKEEGKTFYENRFFVGDILTFTGADGYEYHLVVHESSDDDGNGIRVTYYLPQRADIIAEMDKVSGKIQITSLANGVAYEFNFAIDEYDSYINDEIFKDKKFFWEKGRYRGRTAAGQYLNYAPNGALRDAVSVYLTGNNQSALKTFNHEFGGHRKYRGLGYDPATKSYKGVESQGLFSGLLSDEETTYVRDKLNAAKDEYKKADDALKLLQQSYGEGLNVKRREAEKVLQVLKDKTGDPINGYQNVNMLLGIGLAGVGRPENYDQWFGSYWDGDNIVRIYGPGEKQPPAIDCSALDIDYSTLPDSSWQDEWASRVKAWLVDNPCSTFEADIYPNLNSAYDIKLSRETVKGIDEYFREHLGWERKLPDNYKPPTGLTYK